MRIRRKPTTAYITADTARWEENVTKSLSLTSLQRIVATRAFRHVAVIADAREAPSANFDAATVETSDKQDSTPRARTLSIMVRTHISYLVHNRIENILKLSHLDV